MTTPQHNPKAGNGQVSSVTEPFDGIDYRAALALAVEAAQAAGAALLADLKRPEGPRGSGGTAPADSEAEALIRDLIERAFPTHGICGEELGERDRPSRDAHLHTWWIDPNDGTRAYIKGWRGSAVSIGLTCAGEPVLGVVFAFAAPDDRGDLFAWARGCGPMTRNGLPVERTWPQALSAQVVVLLSQDGDRKSSKNAALCAPARFRAVPSIAYRLALAAAGEGDVAVSLNGPGCLDSAGGHALLRASGGDLYDRRGQALRYHHSWAQDVFGGAPSLCGALAQRPWRDVFAGASEAAPSGLDLLWPDPRKRADDARLSPGALRRAQGCLLGQLAGDSLGGLVEFQSADRIASAYPSGGPSLLADGGTWSNLAGQPTDDSEMALSLARALIASDGFDLDAIALAYAAWYTSEPFDIGTTTSQALSAAAYAASAGKPVARASQAAANANSQANGGLMRVSPLAILGASLSPDALADLARQDASLTHPNPVCQGASAAFCVAIAAAIRDGLTPQQTYASTLSWAERACADGALHPDVLDTLRAASTHRPASYFSQMGWVRTALQNAFYQLLHAPTLAEGVIDTVRSGGDTDTNGAIAGALLGAVHGADAIPTQWRDRVLCCRPIPNLPGVKHARPRAFWPVDALHLAERLLWLGARAHSARPHRS
jgi:ADP-ribosyl-[dinitrogen reductase] hydrolase